ncbi:unnamed protein product [Arctogadus glacialis]
MSVFPGRGLTELLAAASSHSSMQRPPLDKVSAERLNNGQRFNIATATPTTHPGPISDSDTESERERSRRKQEEMRSHANQSNLLRNFPGRLGAAAGGYLCLYASSRAGHEEAGRRLTDEPITSRALACRVTFIGCCIHQSSMKPQSQRDLNPMLRGRGGRGRHKALDSRAGPRPSGAHSPQGQVGPVLHKAKWGPFSTRPQWDVTTKPRLSPKSSFTDSYMKITFAKNLRSSDW